MTVREEQQIGIRWLTEVVWRVWKVLQLPPRLPPEWGRVVAHEESPEHLRRSSEVHDITGMQKPEDLERSSTISRSAQRRPSRFGEPDLPRTICRAAYRACPLDHPDDHGDSADCLTEWSGQPRWSHAVRPAVRS